MKTKQSHTTASTEDVNYSFILRCWASPDGLKRLRLINTRTSQEYILEDIEQLVKLIKSIMANAWET